MEHNVINENKILINTNLFLKLKLFDKSITIYTIYIYTFVHNHKYITCIFQLNIIIVSK